VSQKESLCTEFDDRGKRGASEYCRSGGGEKAGGMLFIVREATKSTGERWGSGLSTPEGTGGDVEGDSDSEEEDSSEVSSSDSVGWLLTAVEDGGQYDDGGCDGDWP